MKIKSSAIIISIFSMSIIGSIQKNQNEIINKNKIEYSEAVSQLINEVENQEKSNFIKTERNNLTEQSDSPEIILTVEMTDKYVRDAEVSVNQSLSVETAKQNLRLQREEVKSFYEYKEQLIAKMQLANYNYYSSQYTSYILFQFADIYEFIDSEAEIQNLIGEEQIEFAYVDVNSKLIDLSTTGVQSNDYTYTSNNILRDIDILNQNGVRQSDYDGTGIKVGVMEPGKTNNNINFADNIVDTLYYSHELDFHPNLVASTAVGDYGVATNADLYLASVTANFDTVSALDWFVENDVNVVNLSYIAYDNYPGKYLMLDMHFDELIENTGINLVIAAGNTGSITALMSTPSLSINAITVGSNNSELNISGFSSYKVSDDIYGIIDKPTVVAPGDSITGIPNIIETPPLGGYNGTSFAAPLVTGMIAILMQEFPVLMGNPSLVRSVIVAGANQLPKQNLIWDSRAGAGIVNYSNSRAAIANYYSYAVVGLPPLGEVSGVLAKTNVYLPANSKINVWSTWDAKVYYYNDPEEEYTDVVTPYVNKNTLSLASADSEYAYTDGVPFITEDSHGNVIGLHYNNKGPGRYVQIQVSAKEKRVQGSIEYGSICYNITPIQASTDNKESIIVSQHDYKYEQQYHFNEQVADVTVDDITFATTRLRTSYTSKEYVVMSPRRLTAGTAYHEYLFPHSVYKINVDLALWSDSELLRTSDCTAFIQYKNAEGVWVEQLDLLNDIYLSKDRKYPIAYTVEFDTPVTEFRFYSTAPQIGALNNTGRLCIGSMKIYYITS